MAVIICGTFGKGLAHRIGLPIHIYNFSTMLKVMLLGANR